ncbi:hypothetical protein [Candidatus Nitrosacidococcus tergens]|uniref:Uncharacterized protein n=1 Tax=Candidatus Nitrosacidococcus tergens TaxID=553981 RepID=A0A7G1Q7C5_9GAMM|nr:hypothetical protein [Candidatus Nitrosacidococcus tergens]CAB1274168.1 conserved exported protein of unknown function [Candidatus Nitrosacidococcus tergens]
MKSLLTTLSVLLLCSVSFATLAEETTTEKLEAKTNDAKRAAQTKVNRAKEATCTDGTMKCLGEKIKDRTVEAYDATKDKAVELKNKAD